MSHDSRIDFFALRILCVFVSLASTYTTIHLMSSQKGSCYPNIIIIICFLQNMHLVEHQSLSVSQPQYEIPNFVSTSMGFPSSSHRKALEQTKSGQDGYGSFPLRFICYSVNLYIVLHQIQIDPSASLKTQKKAQPSNESRSTMSKYAENRHELLRIAFEKTKCLRS